MSFAPETWSMISAFAAVAALALSIYIAVTARGRKEFDDLVVSNGQHGDRLTQLETAVKALPKAAEFHDMRVAMEAIKGSIGVIEERVKPIAAISSRLQEALLERTK